MKKIIIMALTFSVSVNALAKNDLWPDGTKMDKWFENREKVDVNALGKRFVITDYGVGNDSTVVQTNAIQAVIDKAAENGGVVVVPKGTFLSGALFFRQGTHLFIEEGLHGITGGRTLFDFHWLSGFFRYQHCGFYGFFWEECIQPVEHIPELGVVQRIV